MQSQSGTKLGNEWINYQLTYYKFEIDKDGVYRIPATVLQAMGMDLTGTAALRLYHNGQEEALYFSSPNDILGADDYLEFVGFKNTIALDTFLYDDWRQDLLNPYYGLFTDVAAYYLAIDPSLPQDPLRYTHVQAITETSGLPRLSSYRHQEIINFTTSFYKPQVGQLKYSHFQPSEGFNSGLRSQYSTTFSLKGLASEGSTAQLELRMAANNDWPIIKQISWNGELIGQDTSGSGKTNVFRRDLEHSLIKTSNKIDIKNIAQTGLFGLSNVNITYDHNFDFRETPYDLVKLSNSSKSVIIPQRNQASPGYILDYTNRQALALNTSGELVAEKNAHLAMADAPVILTNGKIKTFKNIQNIGASYLFITSEKLYPENRTNNPIDEYAAYRSSGAGGNFKTHILTVEDIYDEFGYGIPNHNWAFKNVSYYLKENWPGLEYVLVVGKSREYEYVRTKEQLANQINNTFFVPTFGTAPSDVLLFSPGRYVNTYFSIGRIAASSLADVSIYLQKVKAHDQSIDAPQEEDKLWLKNIIHLGGGSNAGEQSSIKWFLNQMEDTITSGQFGGQVSSFYKTASTSVQVANLEGIRNNINRGVSVITFFGHAAVGTFEVSLDKPESYANDQKYPFIFSLGCYSGNIHTPSKGISEEFLFAPDRGAIGFIASAGTAYLSTQGVYGTKFYAKLTSNYYGKRLGDMFQEFGELEKDVNSPGEYTLYQQLTFHGDPATRLHGFENPDFTINYSTIKTNPVDILIHNEKFDLSFDIVNIGRSISEELPVKILHLGPKGDTVSMRTLLMSPPAYTKNYVVSMPIKTDVRGKNTIYIQIDPENTIQEITKSNNSLRSTDGAEGYEFNIISDDIFPSSPQNFAIITSLDDFRLLASSSNSLVESQDFIAQLDTTETFDSPVFMEERFLKNGPFVNWKPEVNLIPNKVYYWRVGKINELTQRDKWTVASFIYEPESISEGWNQSEFYQWTQNNNQMTVSGDGTFAFGNALRNISISNGLSKFGAGEVVGYSVDFSTFAVSLRPWNFVNSGVAIAVLDTVKGSHIRNSGGQYGSINGGSVSSACFGFNTQTPEQRKLVVDFLENIVPKGYEVSFMTILNNETSKIKLEDWEADTLIYGNSIVKFLRSQGASYIDLLLEKGERPYTFMFKKDHFVYDEALAEEVNDLIKTNMEFSYMSINGGFVSQKIGPSAEWHSLKIGKTSDPNNTSSITVLGLKANDQIDTLINASTLSEISLDQIDADLYPYLQLYYKDENAETRTPLKINFIKVYFKGLPDIIAKGMLSTEAFDTIPQGKPLVFNLPTYLQGRDTLYNVDLDFQFSYGNNQTLVVNKTIDKIVPKENMSSPITFKTDVLYGSVGFSYNINSDKTVMETTYDNNFGSSRFFVLKDQVNPYLNVYENGRELINDDILTNRPKFTIKMTDNNEFLRSEETNAIVCKILDVTSGKIVYDSELSNNHTVSKSTDKKDILELNFEVELENGEYQLLTRGKDASGNYSSDEDIALSFKVISDKTIKNIYNYPNPFSTSTRFIYEITGERPTKVIIQIYTISGKLVRTINITDFEEANMGKNMTDYSWNATDDFGNRLSNGTYLYTVKAYDIENKLFQSGSKKLEFNKMVIIK